MKKKTAKLSLNKESMRILSARQIAQVAGGMRNSGSIGCASNATFCPSIDLACGDTEWTVSC